LFLEISFTTIYSKIAEAAVSDIGPVVVKIMEDPEKYKGKTVAVTGDYLTPNEVAATFQKGLTPLSLSSSLCPPIISISHLLDIYFYQILNFFF
jgi:hypothetical protein